MIVVHRAAALGRAHVAGSQRASTCVRQCVKQMGVFCANAKFRSMKRTMQDRLDATQVTRSYIAGFLVVAADTGWGQAETEAFQKKVLKQRNLTVAKVLCSLGEMTLVDGCLAVGVCTGCGSGETGCSYTGAGGIEIWQARGIHNKRAGSSIRRT